MSIPPPTEDDVEQFLTKLKAADTDKKVDLVQFFGLKLDGADSLPDSAFDGLTISIAPLIRSTSHLLVTSVLTSFLPVYIPLLPTQHHLRFALHSFLPPLCDKLNDPKDRIQSAASTSFVLLGRKSYELDTAHTSSSLSSAKGKEKEGLAESWEGALKDVLVGKGWRGKVEGLKVLGRMKEDGGKLPLKPWLGTLVDLLEDGDQNVRDQAKETVVQLLSPASVPASARTELKRLIQARGVRRTIADSIMTRVFGGDAEQPKSGAPTGKLHDRHSDDGTGAAPSNGRSSRSGAKTPVQDEVEIVYVASAKDLEGEFARMSPHFAGKETEHNWAAREKSIVRIRGMLRSRTQQKYQEAFVMGLKGGLMDGIAKTLLSLRTTVAQQSCSVLTELVEGLGSAFDQFVEGIMPTLWKMSGLTKKIIAEKSQRCVTAIITHTTCPPKVYIVHVSSGTGDKNMQIRHYCTAHLKTFLETHGSRSRHAIEGTPGLLDSLDGAVKKSLGDVNPAVRELARAAYWSYSSIWPQRAKAIYPTLDAATQKQLDKSGPHQDSSDAVRRASSVSATPIGAATTGKAPRMSTTQMLLAEKRKAKAAELAGTGSTQKDGSMQAQGPRSVSGPVPSSPSLGQASGVPRSSSSVLLPRRAPSGTTGATASAAHSPVSPDRHPVSQLPAANGKAKSAGIATGLSSPSSPHSLNGSTGIPSPRANGFGIGTSVNRALASSTNSLGSPTVNRTQNHARQAQTLPVSMRSASSSCTTSGGTHLKTPVQSRLPLPSFSNDQQGIGLGLQGGRATSEPGVDADGSESVKQAEAISSVDPVLAESLRTQAAQAISAAEDLLDYTDSASPPDLTPITPARPPQLPGRARVVDPYQTPVSWTAHGDMAAWEDSPRADHAVTPLMLEKLRERKHERSWWLRRRQLLDKATPLRQPASAVNGETGAASSVASETKALQEGEATVRDLQKLTLFSTDHPIVMAGMDGADERDVADDRRVWEESKLFERMFTGLTAYLVPSRAADELEHGLVLLWELVHHQWALFEDKDEPLVDVLFGLRASARSVVLESTNSLISLLCEVSDPMYLFSVLRSATERYLAKQGENGHANGVRDGEGKAIVSGEKAKASGALFGLNAIGMCTLRLPKEVVAIEGKRLEGLVMQGLASPVITVRQAANTLVLALQCVLRDATATLDLFPQLNAGQKDLAMYLMERNGLLRPVQGQTALEEGEEGRVRVVEEMNGLLARGVV